MHVQEEGRSLMEQGESIILVRQIKESNILKRKPYILPKVDKKKDDKRFFCKKNGHMKNKCLKFQNDLKRGKPTFFLL